MAAAQLDLADLLRHGAAELTREAPEMSATPEVASRLARVLGARLPCLAVIHWSCPVCRTRTVTRWRCGPRCATCRAAPPSASLLRQIPQVPVRHWVLSLPSPQRFELAGDPPSEAAVVRAFVRAIFARLRVHADDRSAGCGAIAAIHRSGAALNLNLHVHALVVDGVFHRSSDGPRFAAHTPATDDLAVVAREVHHVLARLPAAGTRNAALATLQRAARPRRQTVDQAAAPPQRPSGTSVDLAGVAVFAGVPLPADDRAALRRLCDYITRPAATRLAMVRGGLDKSRPGGAAHARDIVTRLIAATPAEPAVSVRTFGVLAPRAAHEWQLSRGHQLELPGMPGAARTRILRSPRPREPRCERCDVALAALAVEDASDPPMPGT
jgi:hypothetical protein